MRTNLLRRKSAAPVSAIITINHHLFAKSTNFSRIIVYITMTHHFLLYCTLFLSSSLPHFSVLAFLSHNVCRIIHPFCLQQRRHDSIFFAEPIPRPGDRPARQGGDMAYTKVNIDAQLKRYSDIRNVGGVECITDVYARSALQPNIYWFTAKVARCTGTYCLQILKLKIQCSVIVDDKLLVGVQTC
jgi:hypothetical protein